MCVANSFHKPRSAPAVHGKGQDIYTLDSLFWTITQHFFLEIWLTVHPYPIVPVRSDTGRGRRRVRAKVSTKGSPGAGPAGCCGIPQQGLSKTGKEVGLSRIDPPAGPIRDLSGRGTVRNAGLRRSHPLSGSDRAPARRGFRCRSGSRPIASYIRPGSCWCSSLLECRRC